MWHSASLSGTLSLWAVAYSCDSYNNFPVHCTRQYVNWDESRNVIVYFFPRLFRNYNSSTRKNSLLFLFISQELLVHIVSDMYHHRQLRHVYVQYYTIFKLQNEQQKPLAVLYHTLNVAFNFQWFLRLWFLLHSLLIVSYLTVKTIQVEPR